MRKGEGGPARSDQPGAWASRFWRLQRRVSGTNIFPTHITSASAYARPPAHARPPNAFCSRSGVGTPNPLLGNSSQLSAHCSLLTAHRRCHAAAKLSFRTDGYACHGSRFPKLCMCKTGHPQGIIGCCIIIVHNLFPFHRSMSAQR